MRKDGPVQLDGSSMLITGAGSGIGRATAQRAARAGASVIVTDVDLDGAEAVASDIGRAGGPAKAEQLDVTDAAQVAALAERLDVDILVCNAGVGMSGRLTEMSVADWAWIRSVNLDGVLHCCHAFGPQLLARRRGHVVILSSALGYTPRGTEPAYVTTKAAVLALAQCLRADWGRDGVGVSAICPGVINTPIATSTRFLGVETKSQERIRKMFRRGHRPELVAEAIVKAVERNRAVVPVGWEAHLGWWAHRLLPVRAHQVVARQSPG
jgi:2-hydroxycyclohexanecarboxyl-CoA dehydrogenase